MHLLTGRWQLSATRLALLLALFFTLLNYGFFRTIWQAWRSAGGDGTFLWSVPLFIFLCLNIIFHLLLLPYLHKLIIPLILLLSAAVSYSVIFLGVYFDRAMLTNVLITTPAESAKLLAVPYALWLLALGIIPALLYLRVRVAYRRWWRELALRLGAVLLSAAVSYSVIFLGVYFDRAMLTNVLITTPAESAKLLTLPYALWLLALGVVPALLYLRVRVAYRRWWQEIALRLGAVRCCFRSRWRSCSATITIKITPLTGATTTTCRTSSCRPTSSSPASAKSSTSAAPTVLMRPSPPMHISKKPTRSGG